MNRKDELGFVEASDELDKFFLRVASALSGCQLVEQQLKLYIAQAYDLIRKCLADKMPFTMSGDDVENASLERLLGIFGKLCENKQLIADLNRFKEERNFLSHKAITHCLNLDFELDDTSDVDTRLRTITTEAQRLWTAIHDESRGIFVHLWFDDLTQQQ